MTKITVGIPAYRTRFLTEAISSVLTQSFTEFELLISDDSPDGSVAELVARIRDPRIRLIQGPRQGLVPNSVRIWEAAAAPLLKYLYDDDRLYPTALTELTELIEKDERYVFAFSRRDVIDGYGRVIRRPDVFGGDSWVWFEQGALAEHAVRRIVNPAGEPSTMLIRRAAFPDASCLHSFAGLPIRHLVDVAFILNAAARGRAVASPNRLAAFRQHPDQVSADRGSAGFAAGLYEWEILLRGSVETGLVAPNAALQGVPRLNALYDRLGRGLEEIQRLQAGLPELADRLGGGSTQVLTDDFRRNLALAGRLAEARAAQAPKAGAPGAPGQTETVQPRRARLTMASLSRRRAEGWAWLPEQPERAVRVEAIVGDRVVGQAVADQERADLKDIGTGRYGFEMPFDSVLTAEELPSFRVVIEEETFDPGGRKFPPLDGPPPERAGDATATLREHGRFTAPGPDFEEFQWAALADAPRLGDRDPLVIAFYLSQFHAIPENDEFWGAGFTEWRQLARGVPRFPGHYQPRLPRDLGFYNLLDPEVMRRQAGMAKAAGVGAFAFYYYWFDRKRVLERPIEQFLGSDIDMPFFLIWANENWTRAWDGGDLQILLQQHYRPEDEDALLADLARHMRDPRYLRLEGRPLFVLYNPGAVPEIAATAARWRRKWADGFDLHPLIFMAQSFQTEDPRPFGLDGALEFPPHKLTQRIRTQEREVLDAFSRDFSGRVLPYDGVIGASLSEAPPPYPLIKTAVPSWDNDARRPNRGMLLEGSSPEKYQLWLQALIERAIDHPVYGRPLVAVNAWNEWAEGAYLEPDVHYGSAYLNATARALKAAVAKTDAERAAGGLTPD